MLVFVETELPLFRGKACGGRPRSLDIPHGCSRRRARALLGSGEAPRQRQVGRWGMTREPGPLTLNPSPVARTPGLRSSSPPCSAPAPVCPSVLGPEKPARLPAPADLELLAPQRRQLWSLPESRRAPARDGMTPAGRSRGGCRDPRPGPSQPFVVEHPTRWGRPLNLWETSKNRLSLRRCWAAGTRPVSQVPSLCRARGVPTAATHPSAAPLNASCSARGS